MSSGSWNKWAESLLALTGGKADACVVFCPDSGAIWGKAGSAEIDQSNLTAEVPVVAGGKCIKISEVPLTTGGFMTVFRKGTSSFVIARRVTLRNSGYVVGMAVYFENERPEPGTTAIDQASNA